MAEGCCKGVLTGHTEDVVDAALSMEKSSVVTASYDRTARVWDLVTGECTALLTGHACDVHGVEMSPDGGIVVTLAGQEAKVWETESGETTTTLPHFSPYYLPSEALRLSHGFTRPLFWPITTKRLRRLIKQAGLSTH